MVYTSIGCVCLSVHTYTSVCVCVRSKGERENNQKVANNYFLTDVFGGPWTSGLIFFFF